MKKITIVFPVSDFDKVAKVLEPAGFQICGLNKIEAEDKNDSTYHAQIEPIDHLASSDLLHIGIWNVSRQLFKEGL